MPSVSKAQQKFMGMVHAAQKGEKPASGKVAKVASRMDPKDAKDFASTKRKGLPMKAEQKLRKYIREAIREVIKEGKGDTKFQCQECGKKFRKSLLKFAEIKCPKCGGYDVDLAEGMNEN